MLDIYWSADDVFHPFHQHHALPLLRVIGEKRLLPPFLPELSNQSYISHWIY